ncbi:TetR/AcrR family transcriptional regulator [Pseudonocardia sp. TRM90224]|uniref:TetR/AcrR family transcriptional regulator n=1 Tax=Pseudonocardia sp. TRM90224 TaxID=2812678 RepID=UPI001E5266B1|nr:TetR/AcrR family transcriptional regulator [Pseudonocardia sp. TRM90224]
MRRTAEDTAATRAALLDAALFTFAEQGVAEATLAGIAGSAGLTRGAVYHHFADKNALLGAVLEQMWDTVATPVWAALDDPARPLRARLQTFAVGWLTALHTDRRFTALMAVSMQAGLPNDPEKKKAAGFHEWRARLVADLTPAAADLAVDPPTAAEHLLAWLSGTALLAGHDPALVPRADATSVAPLLEGLLR